MKLPLFSYFESRSKHNNFIFTGIQDNIRNTTILEPTGCFEKYCQETNNQPEPKKQCLPNSYNVNCPRVNIWESPLCNVGL